MKTFIISILILGTLSINAGTITNRSTGEVIKTELLNDSIKLDGTHAGSTINTIELTKLNQQIFTKQDYMSDTGVLFAAADYFDTQLDYSKVFSNDYELAADEYFVSLLIPMYNVPLILGTALDLALLPIKLPRKLFKEARVKKDIKLIRSVLFADKKIEVGNKRFLRMMYYLGL